MKIKWLGNEKFSPVYGLLQSGKVYECEKHHADSFVKSGQAIVSKEQKDTHESDVPTKLVKEK